MTRNTTYYHGNWWTIRAKLNIDKKAGIYIPRNSTSTHKAKYINKEWLKQLIESEGYGE